MAYVWVVEMLNSYYSRKEPTWEPVEEATLDVARGREKKSGWMKKNPHDKFRIRKYVREEK